jgi:hypothetical protein
MQGEKERTSNGLKPRLLEALEESALMMVKGLFVFKSIIQHLRQPASKILSFRIRDPHNLRSVNMCRLLVKRSLEVGEMRRVIGWLQKSIGEISEGKLEVRQIRFDGESTKLREGVARPTTVVQLAKWSQGQAALLIEHVTKHVADLMPSAKPGEREQQVKLQVARVSVLPSNLVECR